MEDVITDSVAAPDLLDRSEWLPESFKQQQAQTGEPLLIACFAIFNVHAQNTVALAGCTGRHKTGCSGETRLVLHTLSSP